MARYEQMRHQVLHGGGSSPFVGLTLFLEQGMAGWIWAWRQHTPWRQTAPTSPRLGAVVGGPPPQELVTAFVNMLFHIVGGSQA